MIKQNEKWYEGANEKQTTQLTFYNCSVELHPGMDWLEEMNHFWPLTLSVLETICWKHNMY